MTRNIAVVLWMVGTAGVAGAQNPPPAPPEAPQAPAPAAATVSSARDHGYAWFLSFGGAAMDWGDINSAFNAAGYDDLASGVWQFGGGGYGTVGRLVVGGEGYSQEGAEISSTGGRETRASGGVALFNLGYLLVSEPTHRLYPLVGLGWQWTGLRVMRAGGAGLGPDVNNPTFSQVLQDPGYRSQLSRAGFAVMLGAGAEFTGLQRKRPNGYYGLLLGVRAGYTFVPMRGDWYLYDVPVTGGPDNIGQGFFLRVTIGGAGAKNPRPQAGCPMHGDGHACPMMQHGEGAMPHHRP